MAYLYKDYYSAIKKNELLIYETWVNLQVIMLSEGNKTAPLHQKQYSDFIFIKF